MKVWFRFLPVILGLTVTGVPGLLFAASGHVKFQVVGQDTCTKEITAGAYTLQIDQLCPAGTPIITISPAGNPTALLTMDNTTDTSTDAWSMSSSVSITANIAINNLHLIFLREATPSPTMAYYYKTWAMGAIYNGSGTITVSGTVKRVTDSVTLTIPSFTVSSANGARFEDYRVAKWPTASIGNVNRELQVDVQIVHLDQGATLNLSNLGGWIRIRSQPTADNPDPPEACNDIGNWFITTTCATIHKLGYPTNVIAESTDSDQRTARAYEFARSNWENLSQDMARGEGEHLASLATLLNVPAEQQPAFFELTQERYRTFGRAEIAAQAVASLHETWSSH